MLRILYFELMKLLFSILSIIGLPAFLNGQSARLISTNTTHDFGVVSQTQEVRHVFILENAGAKPLVISHVQNCCGIDSHLASTNIPPQQRAALELVFHPVHYKGPVRKTIYLHTNDPEAKITAFRLNGVVRPNPPSSGKSLDP